MTWKSVTGKVAKGGTTLLSTKMLLKQALNSSILASNTNAEGSQVLMQFIRQREADVEIKFKQLLQ